MPMPWSSAPASAGECTGYPAKDGKRIVVLERVEFVPPDRFYTACFPDYEITVPLDRAAYLRQPKSDFSDDAEGIEDLCAAIRRIAADDPGGGRASADPSTASSEMRPFPPSRNPLSTAMSSEAPT